VDHAPDHAALIGKRVVGEINAAYRVCQTCAQGRPTHCPNRTTLGIMGRDGAFADYLALPIANLYPLPEHISNEQAVFIEPLEPKDRVIIIGDGKLGLLCAQVLALSGCHVTLLGRRQKDHAWLTSKGILVTSEIRDISPHRRSNGKSSGAHDGEHTRPGTIVLKSTYHGEILVNMTDFVIHEIAVIGSRCGSFAPALRLLGSGMIDVEPLIHARFSLIEGIQAMERAAQQGALKVLLNMT